MYGIDLFYKKKDCKTFRMIDVCILRCFVKNIQYIYTKEDKISLIKITKFQSNDMKSIVNHIFLKCCMNIVICLKELMMN